MTVSFEINNEHVNTLGDFTTSLPIISELSKKEGPISITLKNSYKKFIGLKEFLEYQDFIKYVDFENKESDLNIECCSDFNSNLLCPIRTYTAADRLKCNVDRSLILKVTPIEISEDIINKKIIIDRWSNNILRGMGCFKSEDYYWLDYSNSISYNINICLKAKKVIATSTGLPVLLDLFNKEFDLIWFDANYVDLFIDGIGGHKEFFFPERNSKLFYYKDYIYE
jgi:hypothetical protein